MQQQYNDIQLQHNDRTQHKYKKWDVLKYMTYKVCAKNQINIILTTPLISSHPASNWLKEHGDAVYTRLV